MKRPSGNPSRNGRSGCEAFFNLKILAPADENDGSSRVEKGGLKRVEPFFCLSGTWSFTGARESLQK